MTYTHCQLKQSNWHIRKETNRKKIQSDPQENQIYIQKNGQTRRNRKVCIVITIYTPPICICKRWKVKFRGILLYREDSRLFCVVFVLSTALRICKINNDTQRGITILKTTVYAKIVIRKVILKVIHILRIL